MSSFRVFETEHFVRCLERDFSGQSPRIRAKLADFVYPQLKDNPYFGKNIKKLRNWQPETWRYRIGDWRFFYEIDDKGKIVSMTAADNRQGAY